MKLLIIASLAEISTANYFVSAFRQSGHELFICSDIATPAVDQLVSGVIDINAVLQKHNFAADALIFFEGGSMRLLPDTTGCPSLLTAWYAIDTHMDFPKHVRIGRLFDVSFVAQKQYVERLTTSGVTQAQWLPLAYPTQIQPSEPQERKINIAYVGSDNAEMHPERSAMLAALKSDFSATKFGKASPIEMGQIYSSSKIVFNRAVNNDVNMRVFEAMGSGAALLTDIIVDNGMEDLFEDGVHHLTYKNQQHMLESASALLNDPKRAESIGTAAQKLVLEKHTYQHRADHMVAILANTSPTAKPEAADLFAACLSLGLSTDALRASANAMRGVGGGRFQHKLGEISAFWIRIGALAISGIQHLRNLLSSARHG